MSRAERENAATLTKARLTFAYDQETGVITRLSTGKPVGAAMGRYLQISFCGWPYLAHRLAFALGNGYWPPSVVDHRNGDGRDNRLANLRPATKSQNSCNQKGRGQWLKGATKCKGSTKFVAQICVNGRRIYLGLHETEEAAHAAYVAASAKLHGEFARAA